MYALEQVLVTVGGILKYLFLLLLVGVFFLLFVLLERVHLVLDLLAKLTVVDVTLGFEVEPCHVGSHRAVADLLHQVFNFLQ